MDRITWIYVIVMGVCALILIIYWLIQAIRQRKIDYNIPMATMNQFNELERRYKESNGRISPQQLLYEDARGHFEGSAKPGILNDFRTQAQSSDETGRGIQSGNDNDSSGSDSDVDESGEEKRRDGQENGSGNQWSDTDSKSLKSSVRKSKSIKF